MAAKDDMIVATTLNVLYVEVSETMEFSFQSSKIVNATFVKKKD